MDKQEAVRSMTVTMARFTDYISKHLPEDVLGKLRQLRDAEDHPLAKVVYDSMFENLAKAEALDRPSCQDTGVVQYFVKAGAGFPLLSEVRAVLTEAVLIATRTAPLRHNAVQIFQEKNTGNNTGERIPWIDWDIVPDDKGITIEVYLAGGGCSLPGQGKTLMPAAGYEGVVQFVFDVMTSYGVNACPPLLVGVGIGGSIEVAANLSKKALFRTIGSRHPDPRHHREEFGHGRAHRVRRQAPFHHQRRHFRGLLGAPAGHDPDQRGHDLRSPFPQRSRAVNRTLTTPIRDEDIEQLSAGDIVFLDGYLITCRDVGHRRLIELGMKLPVDLQGLAILHARPIVKQDGDGWQMISIGPTTSMRMESFEREFIRQTGVKLIVGKGGMGPETVAGCREHKAVHAVFPGGCAVLAATEVEAIERVEWLDLGMPEALWVCRVKQFGPLIISIDTKGNNLFETNKALFDEKKGPIVREISSQVRFIK